MNENINIIKILDLIPHRYPILLVDKIKEYTKDESIIGIKNVTFNEPHFQGHFPNFPVMPGVLIVEAMAQTSAVLVAKTIGEEQAKGKIVYFMTIDETKFRKPVLPGDVLEMHVVKEKSKGAVWKFKATAYVEGNKVAESKFGAMISDKK